MITIDSRGAGTGKTTTGIYPKITQAILSNQPVLLVVPSVRLQNQYAKQFPGYIHIVNSDLHKNVSETTINRLRSNHGVTCITHQCFIQTSIPQDIRHNHQLIIDEVFDPYGYEEINLNTDSDWNPNLDFANVFEWQDEEFKFEHDKEWHRVRVRAVSNISFFNESAQWRRLTNPNNTLMMQYSNYLKLCNHDKSKLSIITELDSNMLSGWLNVHVAAAAFEMTFMAQWIHDNDLDARVIHEFTPHTLPMTMHMPKNAVNWSNNLRTTDKTLIQKFYDYVSANANGEVLYCKNNGESTLLSNSLQLTHNAHGINEFIEYRNIALATALKPNNELRSFFKNQLRMEDRQIDFAWSGYLFYQLIMRTCLRKRTPEPANVFIIDFETSMAILDLFVYGTYKVVDQIDMEIPPKPKKKKALTGAQRAKLHRQRKNKG